MFRALLLASAVLAIATAPLIAQVPKPLTPALPPKSDDPYAELVAKLHKSKVKFPNSLRDTPLRTVKEQLEKQFDVTIVVREDLFKLQAEGAEGDILDRKFKLDANLSGLPLETFLRLVLQDINATFLVRKHYIEITTLEAAAASSGEAAITNILGGEGSPEYIRNAVRNFIRDTPLVSTVIKGQALEEALAELADTYGFTVVVAASTAEDAPTKINARLMNVPFPTALEVLAVNAGLRIERLDNTFLLTKVGQVGKSKAKAAKPVKK